MSNASEIRDYFKGKGLTDVQVAGILGNWGEESGLNPNANNPNDVGKRSFGLAQWRAERLERLFNYSGTRTPSLKQQLDFTWHELTGSEYGTLSKLKRASTVEQATSAFIGYERPEGYTAANPQGAKSYNSRLKKAQKHAAGTGDAGKTTDAPADSGGTWETVKNWLYGNTVGAASTSIQNAIIPYLIWGGIFIIGLIALIFMLKGV